MSKQKRRIRFTGRMIERGYSPKYYNIPLLLDAIKHEQLTHVKLVGSFPVSEYDDPKIVLKGDSNLLRQVESHYEDLLRMRNTHLSHDELKLIMPEEMMNADLSDRENG